MADNAPLTGYEPNFFDDFHYSETTDIFLQEQSSDTRPSYLHDEEISDDTIGGALSSPDELITLKTKVCRPVVCLSSKNGEKCF